MIPSKTIESIKEACDKIEEANLALEDVDLKTIPTRYRKYIEGLYLSALKLGTASNLIRLLIQDLDSQDNHA